MATVLENQSRHFGNLAYHNNIYSAHLHSSPQFPDSWSTNSASQSQPPAYMTSVSKQGASQPMHIPYAAQIPVSGPALLPGSNYSSADFASSDLLSLAQDLPRSSYSQDAAYQSPIQSSSNNTNTVGFGSPSYPALSYSHSLHQQQRTQQDIRKLSEVELSTRTEPPSFGELDASHGMLALSHQNLTEITPRNLYDARNPRLSTDAYGFPHTNSMHSSSSGPSHRDSYSYYSGSVTSTDSATDYSSAASDAGYDSVSTSRTLPRPTQLMGANLGPPAPQSMMSQFSSKLSSNTQKKHKCRVCDKRFTRPSSLQTHMYSHTGEKPFACNVNGCGRHFSVVSNLRRHRKVHKGEAMSIHSDDE